MAQINPTTRPTGQYAGPLYAQLMSRLRERIIAGDWAPGMVLPSESDLARSYGVSVGTARKALEELEGGGWISRKQGRGTFVSDLAKQHNDRLCRFRSIPSGQDPYVGAIASIIDIAVRSASAEETSELDLGPNGKIIAIQRICRRDRNFKVLESIAAPEQLFQGLAQYDQLPINLFALLINDFGVIPQRSRDRVSAALAEQETAQLLGVPVGEPLLHVESLIWDIDGRPIVRLSRWAKLNGASYEVMLS